MSLYPVFLKLASQPCLIVGGGPIAYRKCNDLLSADAQVSIISPEITADFHPLIHKQKIRYIQRCYQPEDIKPYFLIIAATGNREVNQTVFEEATRHNKLINVVDVPEQCGFYVPSRAILGDLQVAISTTGRLPLLAKKLRKALEKRFYPGLTDDLKKLSEIRCDIIRQSDTTPQATRRIKTELSPAIDTIISKMGL